MTNGYPCRRGPIGCLTAAWGQGATPQCSGRQRDDLQLAGLGVVAALGCRADHAMRVRRPAATIEVVVTDVLNTR